MWSKRSGTHRRKYNVRLYSFAFSKTWKSVSKEAIPSEIAEYIHGGRCVSVMRCKKRLEIPVDRNDLYNSDVAAVVVSFLVKVKNGGARIRARMRGFTYKSRVISFSLSLSEFSYSFFQSLTFTFLHLAFTRAREDKRVNLETFATSKTLTRDSHGYYLFLISKNDTLSFSLVLFHAYILYTTVDRTHDS